MTSSTRRLPVLLAVGLVLVAGGSSGVRSPGAGVVDMGVVGAVDGSPPVMSYTAPLPPPLRVLTAFDPPATPYGPGHLGVDLAATQGAAVHSAGAGTVLFAGQVAGRGVVVIAHPDGIRTEYEPLRVAVRSGTDVAAGDLLGRVAGQHPACAPASCLHWGARRGDTYLDPLDLLRALGPVRLLPWTG